MGGGGGAKPRESYGSEVLLRRFAAGAACLRGWARSGGGDRGGCGGLVPGGAAMGRPDEHYEPCYSFPPVETYLTAYECVANNMRHPHDTGRRLDCQHDIVTLALPCRTLTRVLDATKSPYEFVGTGDGEYSVAADARLDSITVTGPDGTRYVFGAPYEYACDGSIDPYENRTGWALRRIDLASGRCISFRWDLTGNNSFTMTYIGGASYIDNRDPYQFWGNNFDPDFENTDIADGVLSRVNPDGVSLLLRGIDFPGGQRRVRARRSAEVFLH